jgi:hypothetical protein
VPLPKVLPKVRSFGVWFEYVSTTVMITVLRHGSGVQPSNPYDAQLNVLFCQHQHIRAHTQVPKGCDFRRNYPGAKSFLSKHAGFLYVSGFAFYYSY